MQLEHVLVSSGLTGRTAQTKIIQRTWVKRTRFPAARTRRPEDDG